MIEMNRNGLDTSREEIMVKKIDKINKEGNREKGRTEKKYMKVIREDGWRGKYE